MQKVWPLLSYEKAKDTYATLHLWTQIIGKIKLELLPWLNHSWHITLHISPTGLSTHTLPYRSGHFQIELNLVEHLLVLTHSNAQTRQFSLLNQSVASFYRRLFALLQELGIEVSINTKPSEIPPPVIPFELDHSHQAYDALHARSFHQALLSMQDVFTVFRGRFYGKSSPVQFFWGGFDLSLALYSGRKAPRKTGRIPGLPDKVLQDAFSREVEEFGFWPGNNLIPEASFYCYLYPEPEGYDGNAISPASAYYSKDLGQFILPYSSVAGSEDPESSLLEFLTSTHLITTKTWEP